MPYILATTIAGKTKEIEKYFDYRSTRGDKEHRSGRKEMSREDKAAANEKAAIKKLRRLMNANFDNESWYLTMDCIKEEGQDYATPEEMKGMLDRFQRKLRSAWKKLGHELKYVSVMAIGKRSARHFHLVLSSCGAQYTEVRAMLQEIWDIVYMTGGKRRSYIHLENLYGDNYGDLASYFVKQSKTTMESYGAKIGKRWNSSRNLIKPVTIRKVISDRKAFLLKPTEPKGWYIDPRYTVHGYGEEEYGGYEYMRYILIRANVNGKRQH